MPTVSYDRRWTCLFEFIFFDEVVGGFGEEGPDEKEHGGEEVLEDYEGHVGPFPDDFGCSAGD